MVNIKRRTHIYIYVSPGTVTVHNRVSMSQRINLQSTVCRLLMMPPHALRAEVQAHVSRPLRVDGPFSARPQQGGPSPEHMRANELRVPVGPGRELVARVLPVFVPQPGGGGEMYPVGATLLDVVVQNPSMSRADADAILHVASDPELLAATVVAMHYTGGPRMGGNALARFHDFDTENADGQLQERASTHACCMKSGTPSGWQTMCTFRLQAKNVYRMAEGGQV